MGVQYYWPSVISSNPNPQQNIASANVQCRNMSQFCMCTESGECFQPIGGFPPLAVNFYSFCDGVDPLQCHTYAFMLGGFSALWADQGTVFQSTSQFDASGTHIPMGSNSVYLKAISVSCNGCDDIKDATCAPPGTVGPPVTGGPVTLTSPVTMNFPWFI